MNSSSFGFTFLPTINPPPPGPLYPFAIVYTVVFVVFVAWFIKRRHLEPIKSREWILTLCGVIAPFIWVVLDSIETDFYYFYFGTNILLSCHASLWPGTLLIPMWLSPYFVRAYRLFFRFRLQEENISFQAKAIKLRTWVYQNRWTLNSKSFLIFYPTLAVAVVCITAALHYSQPNSDVFYYIGIRECNGLVLYLALCEGLLAVIALVVSIVLLWKVRDYYHFKTELLAMLVFNTPLLILWIIADSGAKLFPPTLGSEVWQLLSISGSFCLSIIFPLALTYSRRFELLPAPPSRSSSFTDQMSQEDAQQSPQVPRRSLTTETDGSSSLRISLSPPPSPRLSSSPLASTSMSPPPSPRLSPELSPPQKTIPPLPKTKPFANPGSRDFFKQALEDPMLFNSFLQFSVQCLAVENCLFYDEIRSFRAIPETQLEQIESRAKSIQATFFARLSPMELNLDEEIVTNVRDAIHANQYSKDMFNRASSSVLDVMYRDTYRKWLATSAFLDDFRSSALAKSMGALAYSWIDEQLKIRMKRKRRRFMLWKQKEGTTAPSESTFDLSQL